MITYRKVREDDLELNSKIEDLNIKVFPSTETTSDLHFLENYYKGASVDRIVNNGAHSSQGHDRYCHLPVPVIP